MIVVTGAAGFIASCLIKALEEKGVTDIIGVDHFGNEEKQRNLSSLSNTTFIERSVFDNWLLKNGPQVKFIFHLGARTDTTLQDKTVFDSLNLNYSKMVWKHAVENQIPLIYASSAATYGNGEFGYSDSLEIVEKLKPLNPYGDSKNDFDKWVLKQQNTPPFWAGLKFFNVFGPNEYHKSRMASVIFHCFNQIKSTGKMRLFQSHKAGIAHGEQKRDFVYVKDVVKVCLFLLENKPASGIYNLGTGIARSFNDLVKATFHALEIEPDIEYIPTPEDIRESYQYFTEADMSKLRKNGYNSPFTILEDAVFDYVVNYLNDHSYF